MTADIRKRYIGLDEVKEITSLSKSTIYRLIETGDFPLQAKIAGRKVGWWLDEVYAWCDEKLSERDL